MKPTVHFGAGALGRGLVIPMLVQSGQEVVAVDTNSNLLSKLKEQKGYQLHISDDENNPYQFIPLHNSLNSIEESMDVIETVRNADIVTTAVRRQNLKFVAPVIYEAWKNQDCKNKQIICCENVENVGTIFRELLDTYLKTDEEKENFKNVQIPDTIVDRICAMSDDYTITSEVFHECSVDRIQDPDTHLEFIPSINNIKGHFYRKRYLMNSYADSISFLGLEKELLYLYEAAQNEEINQYIEKTIRLYFKLLEAKYDIPQEESEHWFMLYRKRLSNPNIPRELNTVARNLWDKLTLQERFVCPLMELKEIGIDVTDALRSIVRMIEINSKYQNEALSKEDILSRLENLWCKNSLGNELYKEIMALI